MSKVSCRPPPRHALLGWEFKCYPHRDEEISETALPEELAAILQQGRCMGLHLGMVSFRSDIDKLGD